MKALMMSRRSFDGLIESRVQGFYREWNSRIKSFIVLDEGFEEVIADCLAGVVGALDEFIVLPTIDTQA